jgi:hypothetical protein
MSNRYLRRCKGRTATHLIRNPRDERPSGRCRQCEIERAERYNATPWGEYVRHTYEVGPRWQVRSRAAIAADLDKLADLRSAYPSLVSESDLDRSETTDYVSAANERLKKHREQEWCHEHSHKRDWLLGFGYVCFDCEPNARLIERRPRPPVIRFGSAKRERV